MPLCFPTPSDPFNLFSITCLFFPAANTKCFISFFSLCCLPTPPCPSYRFDLPYHFISKSSLGLPTVSSAHLSASFAILFPHFILPLLPSLPLRGLVSLLRSDSLLINNAQETGCFYNTDIALLRRTPPRNLF